MANEFPHLFSPLKIGRREIKNRIVFQAHQTCFGFPNDRESGQRYIAYQEARARGGVGMIVAENADVHPTSEQHGTVPSPEILTEKYSRLADAVHKHGATIIAQIGHRGREFALPGTIPPWGFSALPSPWTGQVPHEMTIAEIRELIDAFAQRAQTIKASGLDGVELHASHGYVIQQSYSPFANQRQDEYGGDFQRRLRFAAELIDAVREALGPDLILGMRVSGEDWMEDGLGIDDIIKVCESLNATRKLDYLGISAGGKVHHYAVSIGSTYIPPGVLVPFAAAFKEAFPDTPIWVTDRIKHPAEAETILRQAQADMIGMTRALIADPDLPQKARAGDLTAIRECLSCRQGCIERITSSKPLTCTQNPEAGREYLREIKPAIAKKHVLVAGAGPAGLEAARVAAERGHNVEVFEASNEIGGQIRFAAKAPTREEFDAIIRYRQHELERLEVPIKLNTTVDAEFARAFHADAIILATGASPFRPTIPGADQPHVLSAWDLLGGEKPVGDRVALIDCQGEQESASLADFLLEQGKRVWVITPHPMAGYNMELSQQSFMEQRLLARGAELVLNASVLSVGEDSLEVRRAGWPSDRWTIEGIDTVVVAWGYRANDGLETQLAGTGAEVYSCGDCAAPRRALQAVADGYRVGSLL